MFGDAEAYERFMGRWSKLLASLLVNFADVPYSGRVLDVGSGTGALAFSIARLKTHCQVLGIGPAKEYVSYASSRNPFLTRQVFRSAMPSSYVLPMRPLAPVSPYWYSISFQTKAKRYAK